MRLKKKLIIIAGGMCIAVSIAVSIAFGIAASRPRQDTVRDTVRDTVGIDASDIIPHLKDGDMSVGGAARFRRAYDGLKKVLEEIE